MEIERSEIARRVVEEHVLGARIRRVNASVDLQVCQRFTVVSYCMPGSPHCQADSAIRCSNSRALNFSAGLPSVTFFVHQSRSSSVACMNSSVTRTEWFAFWKKIEV